MERLLPPERSPKLSELRKNPFTGEWTIIAQERGRRPQPLSKRVEATPSSACPFCPGEEHLTPPAVALWPPQSDGASSTWSVRVIPNLFPVLRSSASGEIKEDVTGATIWQGRGYHEVLVESPNHAFSWGKHSLDQVVLVLEVIKSRMESLGGCDGVLSIQVFKNHGAEAGASLPHPHFQLIGLPLIPPVLEQKLAIAGAFWQSHGECVYCHRARGEIQADSRVIELTEHYLVTCPVASRFPYQMQVQPRRHSADFCRLSAEELRGLARVLASTVSRLERIMADRFAYNLILHTAPHSSADFSYFHWHWEILPRSATPAGLEWGSGLFVNSVPPEAACRILKEMHKLV